MFLNLGALEGGLGTPATIGPKRARGRKHDAFVAVEPRGSLAFRSDFGHELFSVMLFLLHGLVGQTHALPEGHHLLLMGSSPVVLHLIVRIGSFPLV